MRGLLGAGGVLSMIIIALAELASRWMIAQASVRDACRAAIADFLLAA